MWSSKFRENLENKRKTVENAGGIERIEKQHAAGKLTARERIEFLFDEGSFVEVGTFVESRTNDFDSKKALGDGVITGYGKINGRLAFASSQDFTIKGGTLGEYHSLKICRIMDMALEARAPYISINDSGGARIEEGINSLDGYSGIFLRNTKASGVIPQIAVIMGPCAGGACYSPAICDFVFMTKASLMFITGPAVVEAVLGEKISASELGGAEIHSEKSGVAHFVYEGDKECLNGVKELLQYLPQNNKETPAYMTTKTIDRCNEIENIVPEQQKKIYDVKQVINTFVDEGCWLEIQENYATNIVIGLARLDGEVIGIVANQPYVLAGTLDINASDKAARFVRFCDCFNIPILTLVDVTGYIPGKLYEEQGIIRHGAKLLYAYSEATVPKVSLIMRKAFGGAYIAMNSKSMGADLVFAWPLARIAVMGAEGAVSIAYKKEIAKSDNPTETKARIVEEYENKYMTPYFTASRGFIDDVIEPEETRVKLSLAFEALKNKEKISVRKKHGNIPL